MKKYIITAFLAVGIFVSCIIPAHAASVSSVVSLVKDMFGVCLETVNQGEEAWIAARNQINSHWQSYSSVSSMGRLYLSYDTMSSLAAELNGDGFPCRLEFNRNLQLYVICGVGEVGSVPGVYVTGLYLTNGSRDLFCCEYNTDSLLSTISSTLTTKLSTLISNVSTIHSDLEGIDLLLSSSAQSLSNLNNYFNGEFKDYFLDIKNDVSSSETYLRQINSKLDTVISKISTGGGTVDFTPIINRLDSLINRLDYPEYTPDSLRWYVQGSYSSSSVSNIGYDALTALSSLAISNNANIEVFDGTNIFTVENIHSVDLVHETINGHTGYFLRAFGSFFRSVNAVNEYHSSYLYLAPAGSGDLFYAPDTSSVSLDISGLENALSNINDNITRLFGEYDSTYEFPLIPTSYSQDVTVSGAKSSLFVSVSDSPDLYYSSTPRLRFASFSGSPSGDSPLGSSYISKPDGVNTFTYFEDLSSNPVPSGTVLHRTFKLRYYTALNVFFYDVPFTVSVSGDSCYIEGTISPKWDSSGSWLGWYLNDSIITSDFNPQIRLLSSPPASGDYYIYSTSSSPVPVVYSTRFTGFLQSQVVLLQNAIGSIGVSDLTGVTTRLDSILGKLDSSSGSDLTALESTAANIESTLSIINDKLDNTATSIENTTVNITNNNPAYNVFYVTDENGEEHSITSVAADSLSASGKLLQFLYKLVVDGALSGVDSAVDGLNDFFFDSSPGSIIEGGSVWD